MNIAVSIILLLAGFIILFGSIIICHIPLDFIYLQYTIEG